MPKDSHKYNLQPEVGNLPTNSKAATPTAMLTPRMNLVRNQPTKDFRKSDGAWDDWNATQERKRQNQRKQAAHDYHQTQKYYGWAAGWVKNAAEDPDDPKTKGIPPPKVLNTGSLEKAVQKVEARSRVTKGGFVDAEPSKQIGRAHV